MKGRTTMQDDRLYDEKELEKSWLLSYSDLITLLFILVVIIAAMYTSEVKEQQAILEQEQKETAEQAELVEAEQAVTELQKQALEEEIHKLTVKRDQLALEAGQFEPEKLEPENVDNNMNVVKENVGAALKEFDIPFEESAEGVVVRLPEQLLFTSGSAILQEEGEKVVDKLSYVLEKFPHRVRIEGHTDDSPIVHSNYVANWELSLDRAKAVMHKIVQERGLSPSRFTVAGYGESKPLVDNTTSENRAKNRRVEIVILGEKE
ncbi:flagellar motor protein MotB [Brevibacillus daliensis]|uniref:flagellar motor protein MotB n=1 Tax=Brevibacillus daliensis TaxID=2892995 RepID=UPI002814C1BD|nr:flagellar motor protein MotB [Brevibacillus daliensis]